MEIVTVSSWLVWIGMVLIFTGGLPAGYFWYGKILNMVEKEKAKKIWIFGTALSIIGLILIFLPIILGMVPEETEAQEKVAKAWFPLFWVAIGLLLIGALPFNLVAQSRVLDIVKLETAQKAFNISFIIMIIGAIILLWIMMPGNMLPD